MPLTGTSEAQIEQYEQQLLAQVPQEGSVGNTTLLRNLKNEEWNEDLFWSIRNRLIERGQLERGRGKVVAFVALGLLSLVKPLQ